MKKIIIITITSTLYAAITVLFLSTVTSCESINQYATKIQQAASSDVSTVSSGDTTVSQQHTTSSDVTHVTAPRIALYWENTTEKHDERKPWSDKVTKIISDNFAIYDKAEDITFFCPKYNKLTNEQKIKAHAEVIVGVVKHESSFNPTSRMVETTMSIDPVTGKQVASEGLLQLSYQDMSNYGSITKGCGIDWSKDKKLSVTDKNKTIFDPLINLECGLRIYTNQLKNRKTILRPIGKGNGL